MTSIITSIRSKPSNRWVNISHKNRRAFAGLRRGIKILEKHPVRGSESLWFSGSIGFHWGLYCNRLVGTKRIDDIQVHTTMKFIGMSIRQCSRPPVERMQLGNEFAKGCWHPNASNCMLGKCIQIHPNTFKMPPNSSSCIRMHLNSNAFGWPTKRTTVLNSFSTLLDERLKCMQKFRIFKRVFAPFRRLSRGDR